MMGRLILAFLLCGLAWNAFAQGNREGSAKWGEVGGWKIRVDRSIGDGCYAHQLYEDETFVRIGFDRKAGTIFFMMGNPAWRSLEVGKIYPMLFVFDGRYRYDGELRGHQVENSVWLDHSNVSTAFAKDFMQRSNMRVFYQGNRIAGLSLENTYAALSEVMNCQREVSGLSGGGGQPAGDLFNRGQRRPGDPFNR